MLIVHIFNVDPNKLFLKLPLESLDTRFTLVIVKISQFPQNHKQHIPKLNKTLQMYRDLAREPNQLTDRNSRFAIT